MLPSAKRAATALSEGEFAACMERMLGKAPNLRRTTSCISLADPFYLPSPPVGSLSESRIAVAFSGGPDSLALCALLRTLYPAERLVGLFVHHGLDSRGVTEDEEQVRSAFARFGIEGHVLRMQWGEGELARMTKGQLQEQTRQRRYRLLLEACRGARSRMLLTGHNLEDDLVTMLYRLGHGSGIDGMAGIKSITPFPIAHADADEHFVGHPLLEIPKERLLLTCQERGLAWNVDASNVDGEYQRNAILAALREMQQEGTTTREKLTEALAFFKDVRRDMHQQLVPLFQNSIFVNRLVGDATFIINGNNGGSGRNGSGGGSSNSSSGNSRAPSDSGAQSATTLLRNTPIISRAIGLVAQYAGARLLPLKTKRMLEVQQALQSAVAEHLEEQKMRQSLLAARVRNLSLAQPTPVDKARRVSMGQMTMGGATFYPLAQQDALRRTAHLSRLAGRTIESGPTFLIQREPPKRINNQQAGFRAVEVGLAPGESFLWDERLYLSYAIPDQRKRTFSISYMTVADVRELEALTSGNTLIRRNVYSYLGSTPGSHLYQVPVIREVGAIYLAFPTLRVQYPLDKYQWSTKQVGDVVLISKFQCLP